MRKYSIVPKTGEKRTIIEAFMTIHFGCICFSDTQENILNGIFTNVIDRDGITEVTSEEVWV